MEANQQDFISIETPRIRKFYDYHSKKEFETPVPQINNFLQLLTSPADCQLHVKLQYMTMRHQDLITNQQENSLSALKTRKMSDHGFLGNFENSSKRHDTAYKSDIEELLFDCEQPGKKLQFTQEQNNENNRRDTKRMHQNLNDIPNGERQPLRDITSQINNNGNRHMNSMNSHLDMEEDESNSKECQKALEIRKRKRKSNQQLKILQAEFERDGFWSKDKILHVARVTGLSESQVYKWCWDQKKKKETDVRPDDAKSFDMKSNYSAEKENISPIQIDNGLNKNSKHIFKTKNSSNYGSLMGKSMEKYRLKKYQKMRFEPTVPKRIDFSLE